MRTRLSRMTIGCCPLFVFLPHVACRPEGAIKCFLIACIEHGKVHNAEGKVMMGMCLPKVVQFSED